MPIKKKVGDVWRRVGTITKRKVDGKTEVRGSIYSYHEARQRFINLIRDFYRKNEQDFSSPEEVFKIFVVAALTGKILPVARLIEKTYSKGSFRKLDEASTSGKIRITVPH
ncbi:MAG: hypothetical protein WED06_00350 [Candidatus Paceibacterota bacterium]